MNYRVINAATVTDFHEMEKVEKIEITNHPDWEVRVGCELNGRHTTVSVRADWILCPLRGRASERRLVATKRREEGAS